MLLMVEVSFAQWLGDETYSRGWGPSELAHRAGVSPTAVQKWLSGASKPYQKTCYAIARALEMPASEVLERAGYSPLPPPVDPTIDAAEPAAPKFTLIKRSAEKESELQKQLAEVKALLLRIEQQLAEPTQSGSDSN